MKFWNNRDDNEPQLIEASERMGMRCHKGGPLDLWIPWLWGTFMPIEVKNPDGFNRFQKSQQEFMAECKRSGWRFEVWRTVNDVIDTHKRWRALQAAIGPHPLPQHPFAALKSLTGS